jgi:hypothetical protein
MSAPPYAAAPAAEPVAERPAAQPEKTQAIGAPEYVERLEWRGASPQRESSGYGQPAQGQRIQGTVYGAQPPNAGPGPGGGFAGPGFSPMENSGSLTGQILAQGQPEEAPSGGGHSKFMIGMVVVVVGLIMLGVVGAIVTLGG